LACFAGRTIDAVGTRKAVAAKIGEQEAEYVLALKGNQGTPHDDVKSFLEDADAASPSSRQGASPRKRGKHPSQRASI